MYDLDRQLSDLASFIEDAVPPVDVADVMADPTPGKARPRRTGLSLSFAVLVAVAIGLIIVVAPFGDPEPVVVDEPTPPIEVTSPSLPDPIVSPGVDGEGSDTAVTAVESGFTWIRVDDPDLGGEGNQSINSIRSVRSGLIAVGQDDYTPAVWLSPDGVAWERIADATGAFGPEYSPYGEESRRWLLDVAANGSRLVAVGIEVLHRPGESHVVVDPAVKVMAFWYSDDGSTWTRVPHDDDTFRLGSGFVNDVRVIETNDGFLAVGEAIWTSPDGVTWTRGVAPGGYASDATATETGILIVGAAGPDARGGYREAAWYSTDGTAWHSSGVESVPTSQGTFRAVTRTADGYLAMGSGSRRLAWFSPDGFTWVYRGGYEENDGYAYDQANDIAAIGETVVGVGVRWPHVGSGATTWESPDGGFTWTVLDDPDILGNARSQTQQSAANSILAFGDRFIVGGRFGGGVETDGDLLGTHDAAVWIGTPTDS